MNSTRATEFITPKSEISRVFRDATLDLAARHDFARPLVNSGRLSVPCIYDDGPLNSEDCEGFPARTRPGAPLPDAPLGDGWLLGALGNGFTLLAIDTPCPKGIGSAGVEVLTLSARDNPVLAERYLGSKSGAVYLVRPDHHVVARWSSPDAKAVETAMLRARAAQEGFQNV